jgi:hypothetical protein
VITNEYVAWIRVVDAHPWRPVQPGAELRRKAVRGIPFVPDRRPTVFKELDRPSDGDFSALFRSRSTSAAGHASAEPLPGSSCLARAGRLDARCPHHRLALRPSDHHFARTHVRQRPRPKRHGTFHAASSCSALAARDTSLMMHRSRMMGLRPQQCGALSCSSQFKLAAKRSLTVAFERVHTVDDWYDGARGGAADYHRQPHAYRSLYLDSGTWDPDEDRFELREINAEVLA